MVSPVVKRGRDDRRAEHQSDDDECRPAAPSSHVADAELTGCGCRSARAPMTPSGEGERRRQDDEERVDRDTEELRHRSALRELALVRLVDDLAVDHPDDPVGRSPTEMSWVTIRNVRPRSTVEPAHQRDDLGGALAVEVAGRLVGPDDRRVVDERARDRDALPLAAGELVRHDGAARSARPTRSSASSARSRASLRPDAARRAAAARRSRPRSAPAAGCRTGRRSPCAARGSPCARSSDIATAATSPRSGPRRSSIASRPERQFSSVVLPQPLGPMIATISPRPIARLTPRSA